MATSAVVVRMGAVNHSNAGTNIDGLLLVSFRPYGLSGNPGRAASIGGVSFVGYLKFYISTVRVIGKTTSLPLASFTRY